MAGAELGEGASVKSARLTSVCHHSVPGSWRSREGGVPDVSPLPSPREGRETET